LPAYLTFQTLRKQESNFCVVWATGVQSGDIDNRFGLFAETVSIFSFNKFG